MSARTLAEETIGEKAERVSQHENVLAEQDCRYEVEELTAKLTAKPLALNRKDGSWDLPRELRELEKTHVQDDRASSRDRDNDKGLTQVHDASSDTYFAEYSSSYS